MHRLLITLGLLTIVSGFGWLFYVDAAQAPAVLTPTPLPQVVEWHPLPTRTKAPPSGRPSPPIHLKFQMDVVHQPVLEPISTPTLTMPQPAIATPTSPPLSPLQGWPVQGAISQLFGCSDFQTGISGQLAGCPPARPYFHDGLDIAIPVGTPIRASLMGTIIFAGADGQGPVCNDGYAGYGLGIVLENEAGWQVLYAHLSEIYVVNGETVGPDQVIGLSGNTGCSSGPHLHFGLRYQGDLVDPALYLE